jgi:hypothetical protein
MNAIALPRPADDRLRDLIRRGLVSLVVAFTNVGASIIVNRILQTGTAPRYIGWGTSATAATVLQTALLAEAAPTTGGGRTLGTESGVTTTVANDTYQVVGTVTAVSTLTIAEAGLFDAATAGNMLIRGNFSAINVVSGDGIAFTIGLRQVPNVV